jgi:hypothetical protein
VQSSDLQPIGRWRALAFNHLGYLTNANLTDQQETHRLVVIDAVIVVSCVVVNVVVQFVVVADDMFAAVHVVGVVVVVSVVFLFT